MIYKLLMVSCAGISGLMTACSVGTSVGKPLETGTQPTVKALPTAQAVTTPQPVTFPSQLPATRPLALPVPALIPPVGTLPPGGSIGSRPDPFSALPLAPTVVIKRNPAPVSPSVIQSIPSPSAVTPVAPSVQPSNAATAQQSSLPSVTVPGTVVPGATLPAPVPSIAPSVVLPAVPRATPTVNLAQAIAVSGVVQAGNRTSVIVQVPNETSSRYAVVGDYLANGKVLIKRIEMEGAEPVVVLEQDGAEFVKPVGSGSLGTL